MTGLHLAQIGQRLDTLTTDAEVLSEQATGVTGGVRCVGCGAYALKPLSDLGWKRTATGHACSADACRGGNRP